MTPRPTSSLRSRWLWATSTLREFLLRRRALRKAFSASFHDTLPMSSRSGKWRRAAAAALMREYSVEGALHAERLLGDARRVGDVELRDWAICAIADGCPEGLLWAFPATLERPDGEWTASLDAYRKLAPELVLAAIDDPVLGPVVSEMRSADEGAIARLSAVVAVKVEVMRGVVNYGAAILQNHRPWGPTCAVLHRIATGSGPLQFTRADLTGLIVERPQDADRIARIVVERNTDDLHTILSLLDSETVPLADGWL